MTVVGELYVDFKANLSNLEAGFASAKSQSQSFSTQAGDSLNTIGDKAEQAGKDVSNLGDEAKKSGEKISQSGKQGADSLNLIGDALIAIGAVKAFETIYQGFKKCIDASIEFESALAGVQKTTNLTDSELAAMGEDIRQMSTEIPATTTEIAAVAEAAGQLGISGAENILNFTETMTMLGTATNMTADEAATMLAQFANITSLDPSEYMNLGSAITALGNSTATTESKITEMSQGMAASATNAGIAEPAILAMAAATASVGIEAEAGSTSWSKFIQDLQSAVETGDDLEQWAAVANMTGEEFAQIWGQDAAQAINLWIQGLGDAAANGESMTAILNNLNITEVREVRMLQSLANAGDLLSNALETGNTAWEENTALQKEASTRYSTTESRAKKLANAQQNLAATIGDQLNPLYSNLLGIGEDVVDFFQDLFDENEALAPALAAVAVGAGVATAALISCSVGAGVATKAVEAFKTALETPKGPITLLISLIGGLVAAIATWAASLAEVDAESEALISENESLITTMEDNIVAAQAVETEFKAQAETTDNLINKLDQLTSSTALTSAEQAEAQKAVADLNALYPELSLSLETTGNSADGFRVKLKSASTEIADADGNVIDITGSLKDMASSIADVQEQQEKFATTVQLFEDLKDAESQLTLTNTRMAGSVDTVAQSLGVGTEAAEKITAGFAGWWDVFANIALYLGGFDKDVRDAVESYDELNKSAEDLQATLDETEAAIKANSGANVELTNIVYDAAGNIEYVVDTEGNHLNMMGEVLATTEQLTDVYNDNITALSEAGVSINDFTEATRLMTEAEAEEYAQQVLSGEQYDLLLEKYGTLSVTKQQYIEDTKNLTAAEIETYNQQLLEDAQLATLSTRYNELYTAASESINGQFELWDVLDEKVTISSDTFMRAQQTQSEYWSNLSTNLSVLTDMINNNTVPGLATLAGSIDFTTQEGAAMADMLANASEEELPKMVEQFLSTQGNADTAAGAIADLGTAVELAGTDASNTVTDFNKFQTGVDDSTTKAGESVTNFGITVTESTEQVSGDLDSLETDVQDTMSNIKSYVEDLNATMPEIQFKVNQYIPLPHFSMSGRFNAKSGSVPTVSVSWYDQGGLFATPQVIGIAERRPEFVGAAEDLEAFIDKSFKKSLVDISPIIDAQSSATSNVVYFQPKIELHAQKVTDAEALRLSRVISREFAKAQGGRMS